MNDDYPFASEDNDFPLMVSYDFDSHESFWSMHSVDLRDEPKFGTFVRAKDHSEDHDTNEVEKPIHDLLNSLNQDDESSSSSKPLKFQKTDSPLFKKNSFNNKGKSTDFLETSSKRKSSKLSTSFIPRN